MKKSLVWLTMFALCISSFPVSGNDTKVYAAVQDEYEDDDIGDDDDSWYDDDSYDDDDDWYDDDDDWYDDDDDWYDDDDDDSWSDDGSNNGGTSDNGTNDDGFNNADGSEDGSQAPSVETRKLSNATITLSKKTVTYTGKEIKPTVTVVDEYGRTLKKGKDYTVTYTNNIDAGKATVQIDAVADDDNSRSIVYTGSKKTTFKIKKNMKKLTFSEVTAKTYTGSKITPGVTVTDTLSDGKTKKLKAGTDYTIRYAKNKACGVAKIIIKGKGNYQGYHLIKFSITPKLSGLKVSSPFAGEATVTWNKVSGADGFYVYRKSSGSSDYKYIANITDSNYQVFHDTRVSNNTSYSYKIVPYVIDEYPNEALNGTKYTAPKKSSASSTSMWNRYKNLKNYYSSKATVYYEAYDYSCILGRAYHAYESTQVSTASGTVTSSTDGKRYTIYTGDAAIDYMVSIIDGNLIKSTMSTEERVKAIYNWMVANCTFNKDVKDPSQLANMKKYIDYGSDSFNQKAEAYEKSVMKQIYEGTAVCIGTDWHDADRAAIALAYRQGSCSFLTPMFNVLCNGAGVEAYIIDGEYVNRDGSSAYHNWSYVKIGSTYYWFDVPVACKNKSAASYWYKKGTTFWKTCHSWDSSSLKGFNTSAFAK